MTTQNDAAQWREIAQDFAFKFDQTPSHSWRLRLRDELEQLLASATAAIRQERDAWQKQSGERFQDAYAAEKRALTAEARCAAMQVALQKAEAALELAYSSAQNMSVDYMQIIERAQHGCCAALAALPSFHAAGKGEGK